MVADKDRQLMRNLPADFRVVILGALSVLAIPACGSNTSIEQQWTAPTAQTAQLHKVAVVLISPNVTLRHTTEDAMARQLAKTGTQAVPGYMILDDQDVENRDAAKAKLHAAGFDGVLTMRMVSAVRQVNVIPGGFDGYWGTAWGAAYEPAYVETETIVRVETNAYSLIDGTLLWTALSKTIDPNNTNDLIANVTKVVAKQLEHQGIVV